MKGIILFILMSLCSVVSATRYYVAPDGNDISGKGSIDNPWFALNRAWMMVSTGDTIYMRGGTYYYTKQVLTGKNGTESNRIKIWAFPTETPVIKKYGSYAGTYWPRSIIQVSGNYIHVRGLEICYNEQEDTEGYGGLINLNGNYNIYELLNIHHNGGGLGIEYNSTGNLILNCDIHHNADPLSSDKYGNADGIGLSHIPAGLINTVRGCRLWWNSDDGIDPYGCDSKLEIDNCWSWYNGYIPDTFEKGGDGNGFKFGKTASDYGSTIAITTTNCISYKNRTAGFHQNEANAAIVLYNNTAYFNGAQGFWFGSFNKSHILQNNISYHNASYCYLTSSSIVSNNTFLISNTANPAISVTDTDFISLDGMQLTRLRKADGSLPDIEFLHLASGSDLIDAGADVGKPYYGKAPDIGAFEIPVGEFHLNEPPVVNISSPNKGVTFTSPATVTIDVEVSDPDGSISKVELFNGTKKLDERTFSPFSFTLKDLPEGTYSLIAVATDNLNASAISSILDLKVISNNEDKEFFNLYPNPNDGRFTINFTSPLVAENYTVTILNLIGTTFYQEKLLKDDDVRQFDLSHLNPGTYVVMISGDAILITQKFIKG